MDSSCGPTTQLENRTVTCSRQSWVTMWWSVMWKATCIGWIVPTGTIKAMQQLDSSGLYAAPLVDGDTLYVQSRGGKLYAIKRP